MRGTNPISDETEDTPAVEDLSPRVTLSRRQSTGRSRTPSKRSHRTDDESFDDDEASPKPTKALQEKLDETMHSCLADFSLMISQHLGQVQEHERGRANAQWTNLSQQFGQVITSMEKLLEGQETFRNTVVEAVSKISESNASIKNDLLHQQCLFGGMSDILAKMEEKRLLGSPNIHTREEPIPLPQSHRVRIKREESPDISLSSTSMPSAGLQQALYTERVPSPPIVAQSWNHNDADPWLPKVPCPYRDSENRSHKLNPPPKFDSRKLDSWFRHMRFWRELYFTVDETQILPSVVLAAGEDTRDILMDYTEDTKTNPESRSLGGY